MLTATEAAAALGVSKRHLYIACGAVWFYNEIWLSKVHAPPRDPA